MAEIVNVKAVPKNENEKLKVSGVNYMKSYAIIYLLGCMPACSCVHVHVCADPDVHGAISQKQGSFFVNFVNCVTLTGDQR